MLLDLLCPCSVVLVVWINSFIGASFSSLCVFHALQASSHVLCLMVLGGYLVLKGSAAWHPLMPAYSSAMCAALGTMWLRNFFRALTWALRKRQSGLRRKLASIALYGRNT